MTPKTQLMNALIALLQPEVVPDFAQTIEATLDAQAFKTERDAPYITVSWGDQNITTASRQSRDHRQQATVVLVTRLNESTVELQENFELTVMGTIDTDPTLGGLAHQVKITGTQPGRVDEQLAGLQVSLELHYTTQRT